MQTNATHSDAVLSARERGAGERRATDRLLRLWQSTPDKSAVLQAASASSLWRHCFLFVVDDEPTCSVIIESGEEAARGLALRSAKGSLPLTRLVPALGKRIHRLGLACRSNGSPGMDYRESDSDDGIPVRRYRMAVVPLTPPARNDEHFRKRVTSMLGVFTYQ